MPQLADQWGLLQEQLSEPPLLKARGELPWDG